MIVQELQKKTPYSEQKIDISKYSLNIRDDELQAIRIANATSCASMISMIFKYFISTGEYVFFIKRLKNILRAKKLKEKKDNQA